MTIDQTPIADKVAEMHASRPTSSFRREQEALAGTRLPGVALTGTVFPDGDLLDVDAHPTTFREIVHGAPTVVIFYRGAWCPYCNLALATYGEQLAPHLKPRGIALVAISPQKPDGSLTTKERHELEFTVLSDPGNQIGAGLGILTRPSPEARETQLAHGLDLTEVNADGTTTLPMPTVAIVSAEGVLAWIDVHADCSTRTEPRQILDALADLGL